MGNTVAKSQHQALRSRRKMIRLYGPRISPACHHRAKKTPLEISYCMHGSCTLHTSASSRVERGHKHTNFSWSLKLQKNCPSASHASSVTRRHGFPMQSPYLQPLVPPLSPSLLGQRLLHITVWLAAAAVRNYCRNSCKNCSASSDHWHDC